MMSNRVYNLNIEIKRKIVKTNWPDYYNKEINGRRLNELQWGLHINRKLKMWRMSLVKGKSYPCNLLFLEETPDYFKTLEVFPDDRVVNVQSVQNMMKNRKSPPIE